MHIRIYVSVAKVRATCIKLKDKNLANLKTIKAGRDIIEIQLFEEGKLANGPGTTDDPGF